MYLFGINPLMPERHDTNSAIYILYIEGDVNVNDTTAPSHSVPLDNF